MSCKFLLVVAQDRVTQLQVVDTICYIAVPHTDQLFTMLEKNLMYEIKVPAFSLTIKNVLYLLHHGTKTGVLAVCTALVCLNGALIWVNGICNR